MIARQVFVRSIGSRQRSSAGLTITEVLLVVAVLFTCVCATTAMMGSQRGGADSQFKLAELAQANACYANDFAQRQFTAIPDSAAITGDVCATFLSTRFCPSPLWLGKDNGGGIWAFYIGGSGCGNYPGNCGNWSALRTMNFANAESEIGAFRIPNALGFREYLCRQYYSTDFFAQDDPAHPAVVGLMNSPGEFVYPATGISSGFAYPSYCWSPAAMLHPGVLRSRAEGGFQVPSAFTDSYRSPSVTQCMHPSLKTRMTEYNWLRNAPQANLTFNSGAKSSPYTLFFDGSVQSISMAHAEADDAIARAGSTSGDGLWSDDTTYGSAGWQPTASVDGTRTSFHILTTGGILGRDLLTRD